ncbi:MAG: hypothetical protein IKE60_14735 [Reyranella sp.]|uniref:hypothetical protein n=1 Tax=Reyranella sp. TaxID=1929291 RepID=UPI0025D531F2|nr:hypothetical protein [Reyranella sp.]MBR2815906.1 hypothetical protein [Reyranella sp.]
MSVSGGLSELVGHGQDWVVHGRVVEEAAFAVVDMQSAIAGVERPVFVPAVVKGCCRTPLALGDSKNKEASLLQRYCKRLKVCKCPESDKVGAFS